MHMTGMHMTLWFEARSSGFGLEGHASGERDTMVRWSEPEGREACAGAVIRSWRKKYSEEQKISE